MTFIEENTFCIISSILFSLKLLLVSLPTLPPTLQQISVAWLIMWSIHYMSVCIVGSWVLQQWVIGGE